MNAPTPIFHDRETARAVLTAKLARPAPYFSNSDEGHLRRDTEWRLRWIDCAPDGANHCVAPMQDKRGVPMGTAWSENVGPGRGLREARAARGLCPLSGRAL